MPRPKPGFDAVRSLAGDLAGVEESTMYGAPALKLHGKFLACIATNKAAEPDTLVVSVGFDQREALIAEDPAVYYLKDHYLDYPVVLVRLPRIDREALRGLLREAWRFVSTKPSRTRRASGSRRAIRTARPR
jgi:hypothetical protein